MQQLLREWESRLLAGQSSTASLKPMRTRIKPEAQELASDASAEVAFIACPCDRCGFRQQCMTGFACERYTIFLDGSSEKRWAQAPCEPTQARFDALFN